MALDTADKRASAIGVVLPFRVVLPQPEGALDQGDRQQVASSYRGILASVLIPPVPCVIDLLWSADAVTVLNWKEPAAELVWSIDSPETLTWCRCCVGQSEPVPPRRQRPRAPIHARR